MQLDRYSSKTEAFHGPTINEPVDLTSSEMILIFAIFEYGREGVFRIKKRSLVQKL